MILFFDCETNGLPRDYKAPYTDVDNWPRITQIALILMGDEGQVIREEQFMIKPDGWVIPDEPFFVEHGMSTERSENEGIDIKFALETYLEMMVKCNTIVAHNIDFDAPILQAELLRLGLPALIFQEKICTMKSTTDLLQLPGPYGFKWPKLEELCAFLGVPLEGAHDALNDVRATSGCYFELKKRGLLPTKRSGGITYTNIVRYDNLPATDYFSLGGFSHSRVKRDNNGSPTAFAPTPKMLMGSMVDRILTEPDKVDVKDPIYPVARKIAITIREIFGDVIDRFKSQVSYTADLNYNGLTMRTNGRLDWLLEKHAVIDLKFTTAKKLEPVVNFFGYRNQIWNYAKMAGLKKGYIIAYSDPLGECLPVFPIDCSSDYNEFWGNAVMKFGSVTTKRI